MIRVVALTILWALAFVVGWKAADGFERRTERRVVESETDKHLALAAAQTPSNIGSRIGDKRRLTLAQKLEVLRSQLVDPYRNMTFDGELRAEIDRLERRLGVKVASKEGR